MRRPLVTSYAQELALFSHPWQKVGLLAATTCALVFPFWVGDEWMTIGLLALIAVVGSIALMVLTGFAGQVSLGHAAFLALGAYTTAILGERLALPFFLLLPLAGAVSAAVGLAVGVFALRLKGLYLAIVTIGLIFLVNHVLVSFPALTGGLSGISVRAYTWFGSGDLYTPFELGPFALRFEQKLYFLYLALAVLVTYFARNLVRSDTGRAMAAVRDQDLAASALGVHPARVKVIAFGISSFLAGVAGAMFALQQQYITIDPPFNLYMSVNYIAMVVLGGVGTVFGAVAGALAYVMLQPLVEKLGGALPLLGELGNAQRSTVLFSLLVLGLLAWEPLGLYGLYLRARRYFAAWPFRY